MNQKWKVFVLLYLLTLGIMLYFNLTHDPINDRVKEYETYQLNIEEGWHYRRTLVNSSLVTTWVPAMIQRATGLGEMGLFKVFPTFFYALLPGFAFLIARRYLSAKLAIVAALLVIANSHILFFPDIGRVGVGIAFFGGMIWALLEKKMVWASVFALLVVFSHYGTSLIAWGLVAACLAIYGIHKRGLLRQYLVVFLLLTASIGIWHLWIASYSGWVMVTYGVQQDMPGMTGDVVGPSLGLLTNEWLDVGAREPAVQAALGMGISGGIPEVIEVLANWAVVLLTTLGVWVLLRSKEIEYLVKVLGAALWLLVVLTVAVPWLSTFYGGMRVFFTGMPVLAMCFVLGAKWVAQKVRLGEPMWVYAPTLLLFAFCTTGLVYRVFGDLKTVPVYFSLGSM